MTSLPVFGRAFIWSANNTDLTILQRLVFLGQTQKGPSEITATDVHGKVLHFLRWADGDDMPPDQSDCPPLLLLIRLLGRRVSFGQLVDLVRSTDVFTDTAYPDQDFTNVDLNSDWPSDITE